MNEKLYDLLEKVQSTAVQVSDTAADAAYGVRKKAGELLSVAKLNILIADRKAAVNTTFRELGEMLYATHTGTPTDSEKLLAKLEEADALKAEIAAFETQIGREAAACLCPTCGAVLHAGDRFCRECGGPL